MRPDEKRISFSLLNKNIKNQFPPLSGVILRPSFPPRKSCISIIRIRQIWEGTEMTKKMILALETMKANSIAERI